MLCGLSLLVTLQYIFVAFLFSEDDTGPRGHLHKITPDSGRSRDWRPGLPASGSLCPPGKLPFLTSSGLLCFPGGVRVKTADRTDSYGEDHEKNHPRENSGVGVGLVSLEAFPECFPEHESPTQGANLSPPLLHQGAVGKHQFQKVFFRQHVLSFRNSIAHHSLLWHRRGQELHLPVEPVAANQMGN